MAPTIQLRPITRDDVLSTRALRLEALQAHPEAFGSDYGDLVNAPESTWADRVRVSWEGDSARISVAEVDGKLVGMAGVVREVGAKVNHQAFIWGVYVRPESRGKRVAERLVQSLIDWCRERQIRNVRLSATTSNAAAIRCYQRLGFCVYGVHPEVIRVGDVYHDEILMWRRVEP